MPMSPRLLRPRQTIHPEAADWANRVRTNGGSVSGTTLNAVDRFVKAIHAAGIRDRFYRLNLFCGNSDANLAAVRTPLFRGPSLTGMQFGNATDTNVNFVAGDYAETGASGGLTGNGSTKYLDTGFPMNTLPSTTSGHASVYCRNRSSSNSYRSMIGANHFLSTGFGVSTDAALYSTWGNHAFGVNSTNGLLVATRTSTTSNIAYANGAAVVTNTAAVTPTAISVNATVFAALSAGTPSFHDSRTYGCYSIGTGLTAAEVTSLTNAVNAFQQSLGRA